MDYRNHNHNPPTQVFPPVANDFAEDDSTAADRRELTGLASWFEVKPFLTEIVVTAIISGIVTFLATSIVDTVLAKTFSNYEALGWGFSLTSASLVAGVAGLAAGILILLFIGTRSPYQLYSLLFWSVIPALVILVLLTQFSVTVIPYIVTILLAAIPISLIPARSDRYRTDS